MFGNESEPFTLARDVDAVIIPAGQMINLREGTSGYITQSLGGSFTVYVEGSLFRIAGVHADALGKEPVPPPSVPENATDADIEDVVWAQLRTCFDPEIPVNIADLGLIYRCEIRARPDGERDVDIDMTLTAPGCGMGDILVQDVRDKIAIVPTVASVSVEMVFDPPWNQMMMTEEARLQLGML
ncbi:MAG: putative Fe-S cluster assembly protein SufT [Pseudomonadota bacterium]